MTSEAGTAVTGPDVTATRVTFRLADPGRRLAAVRLVQEVRVPGDRLDFARVGDGWRLELARPPVWRMEYRFELRHGDGGAAHSEQVCDPGNPAAHRVHSVTSR